MADIALSIGANIIEYLVEPVLIRPLRPIFCYKSIVDDFRQICKKLSIEEVKVKDALKQARDNGQEIYEHVDKWVEDARKAMEDAQKLQNELGDDKSCCFGWTFHYMLSKRVWENTNSIEKLCETVATLNQVGREVDLVQYTGLAFSEDFTISKSAQSAFRAILEALNNDNVNVIGLYGMGGVGKTTLANEVCKEAENSKIFDRAVMVAISQTPDIRRIQGVVADFLGLKLEQETEEGRASKLSQRLKSEKILVILDDVWKPFDLAHIGMSGNECKGCKILLTTRRCQVCTSMECQKAIPLDLLSKDEALKLFKKKAHLGDGSELEDVANQIVEECKGLPIALVTVGSALRNKTAYEWIEALQKLEDARLVDILGVGEDEKNAYKCLQLSYDYLKHSGEAHQAQFLLLLCSLFPEDWEIDMEDLCRCAFGMGLFGGVKSVQDVRRKVWVTVQFLKDSSLLLDTDKKEGVKMHDVVRDAALWIGGRESVERRVFTVRNRDDMNELIKKESFKDSRVISFIPDSISELSDDHELVCPKLETVLIFCNGQKDVRLHDAIFNNMKGLKVLAVHGGDMFHQTKFSVPKSLQHLTDIRMVNLGYCYCSNGIVLGELGNLEILCLADSEIDCAIEAVLMKLKILRLLDLRRNWQKREYLPSNVIKEMAKLEELYTHSKYSFGNGEIEGTRSNGCSLLELNSTPNLARFSAHFKVGRLFPVDFCFPNLEWYFISMGDKLGSQAEDYCRVLSLHQITMSQLKAFKKLFSAVEYLSCSSRQGQDFKMINSCFVNTLMSIVTDNDDHDHATAPKDFLQNLRVLKIWHFKKMETVFRFDDNHELPRKQKLQELGLYHLSGLKHIWKGPFRSEVVYDSARDSDLSRCFKNLRKLHVWGCKNLKAIYSSATRMHLPKLEEIELYDNPELEQVFETEQCPSLEVLRVRGYFKLSSHFVSNILSSTAKKLRIISLISVRGVENIMQLQRQDENHNVLLTYQLEELRLENLEDLKCICSGTKLNTCSFSNLKEVIVGYCNNLKQLFTATIASSLKQLRELDVRSCAALEEIISDDDQRNGIVITFPKLVQIRLRDLPSLVRFCPATYRLMFPRMRMSSEKVEVPDVIADFLRGEQVTLKEEKQDDKNSFVSPDYEGSSE